jgi:hypothetical protein
VDARKELRVAHHLFSDFGMEAFAERARVELQATGEHAQDRPLAGPERRRALATGQPRAAR